MRIIFLNAGIACGRKGKAPRAYEAPGLELMANFLGRVCSHQLTELL